MRGESLVPKEEQSNFRRRKFAPKKIWSVDERISFRDLAKFAARRKTIEFLCERTGCDASTAKRWLNGASRVPDRAVYALCADIFSRLQ
jgi:hypothetical protein